MEAGGPLSNDHEPIEAPPEVERPAEPEPQGEVVLPEITGLIYAHNDETTVGAAIADLSRTLASHASAFEILVVDDASTDGTAAVVERAAADQPAVRLVRHRAPPGYGAAIRQALALAGLPLIVQTDARSDLDPTSLAALLAEMEKCDIVVGRCPRRRGDARHRLDAWLFWLLCRVVFGIPFRDVNGPLKLYRRDVFDRIRIQSDGLFADAEVLAKAGFFGMMIGEVPVKCRVSSVECRVSDVGTLIRDLEFAAEASVVARHWPLVTRRTLREAWRVLRHPVLLPPPPDSLRPEKNTQE